MTKTAAPPVGKVPWKCWCGLVLPVGGDVGDNTGWDGVRAHRAEHKRVERRVKA